MSSVTVESLLAYQLPAPPADSLEYLEAIEKMRAEIERLMYVPIHCPHWLGNTAKIPR